MDEPKLTYHYGDMIHSKTWCNDKGERHCINGPALLCYHDTGYKHYEEWRIDGLFHRYDGPAIIKYTETGDIAYGVWYMVYKWQRD